MLTALLRGEADMAARLTPDLVAETPERAGKVHAVQIARQPGLNAANTSSRTFPHPRKILWADLTTTARARLQSRSLASSIVSEPCPSSQGLDPLSRNGINPQRSDNSPLFGNAASWASV